MSDFYRLELDDYSAASFTSFTKYYFGTLAEIEEWLSMIATDKRLSTEQSLLLEALQSWKAGNKNIAIVSAYRKVPFLTPAKLLNHERFEADNFAWKHLNTWQWPYYMRCEKVTSDHYWFSCEGEYFRGVRAQFQELRYGTDKTSWDKIGVTWGFPKVITMGDKSAESNLIEPEKAFKTKVEAMRDWIAFRQVPSPDYSEFCNDIFGDG